MSVKFWFVPTFGDPALKRSLEKELNERRCQPIDPKIGEMPNVVLVTDFDQNLQHVKDLKAGFGDDAPFIVVIRTTGLHDEVKAKRFRKAGANLVMSYPTATNTPQMIVGQILRRLPNYLAATG